MIIQYKLSGTCFSGKTKTRMRVAAPHRPDAGPATAKPLRNWMQAGRPGTTDGVYVSYDSYIPLCTYLLFNFIEKRARTIRPSALRKICYNIFFIFYNKFFISYNNFFSS